MALKVKVNVKQLTVYLLFGVLTTVVNWSVYIVLQELGLLIAVANAIAWMAAVTVAFITTKKYIFKNKAASPLELFEQILLFVLSRLLTGLLEIFLPSILYEFGITYDLFGIKGFLAKAITNGIVILVNYVLNNIVVFPEKNIIAALKIKLKKLLRCSKIKSTKLQLNSIPLVANYHTHTTRCNHAVGFEEEYIEMAILAGFTDLGFADHVPYLFPDESYVDGAKMSMDLIGDYFDTLLRLRKKYADKIKIHIGFEAEYYESCFDKTFDKLMEYPLDYLILGQHRIGDYTTPIVFKATSDEQDLQSYVDTVVKAINTGKFSYVAHPDVINFKGDDETFYKHMRRLCAAAKENNVPLEINMLGAATNRNYPSERFFKLVAEMGNEVIVGCDAHSPDMIISESGYERCREILDKYGITPLNYLVFKKLR